MIVENKNVLLTDANLNLRGYRKFHSQNNDLNFEMKDIALSSVQMNLFYKANIVVFYDYIRETISYIKNRWSSQYSTKILKFYNRIYELDRETKFDFEMIGDRAKMLMNIRNKDNGLATLCKHILEIEEPTNPRIGYLKHWK